MKKLRAISVMVVLVMVVACFVSCDKPEISLLEDTSSNSVNISDEKSENKAFAEEEDGIIEMINKLKGIFEGDVLANAKYYTSFEEAIEEESISEEIVSIISSIDENGEIMVYDYPVDFVIDKNNSNGNVIKALDELEKSITSKLEKVLPQDTSSN